MRAVTASGGGGAARRRFWRSGQSAHHPQMCGTLLSISGYLLQADRKQADPLCSPKSPCQLEGVHPPTGTSRFGLDTSGPRRSAQVPASDQLGAGRRYRDCRPQIAFVRKPPHWASCRTIPCGLTVLSDNHAAIAWPPRCDGTRECVRSNFGWCRSSNAFYP